MTAIFRSAFFSASIFFQFSVPRQSNQKIFRSAQFRGIPRNAEYGTRKMKTELRKRNFRAEIPQFLGQFFVKFFFNFFHFFFQFLLVSIEKWMDQTVLERIQVVFELFQVFFLACSWTKFLPIKLKFMAVVNGRFH